jgi:ubiquitin-protein ligase
MPNLWQKRWNEEYQLAIKENSPTHTIVPIRKDDLSTWRMYVRTRDGRLHSAKVRLEYLTGNGRTLVYPLFPPSVEWETPIRHPNIQPPRPEGEGILDLALFQKTDTWNPKTHLIDLIGFVELLLDNPNPADPINHPVCLQAAIDLIREQVSASPSSSIVEQVKQKLTEADAVIRKYSGHWNKVGQGERGRAWYLVVEAGRALSQGHRVR